MKRTLSLLLTAALALSLLAGCGPKQPESASDPYPGQTSASSQPDASAADPGSSAAVDGPRLMVLSGPTGVGAAKMMTDMDGISSAEVVTDNTQVQAALNNKDVDIAAIATNAAAVLASKNPDSIQVLAVNTLGVLYILEKGDTVHNMADLAGKTLYAPSNTKGANPEHILNHLLEGNGVSPSDVNIQWLTPQEITAKMSSDHAGICMLPVPAATALLVKDSNIREAVSLSDAWMDLEGSELPMGCVVARAEFLEKSDPALIEAFLDLYGDSISFMEGPDAGSLAVELGILPNEKVAEKAIPQCSLTFVTGQAMRTMLEDYYSILFQAAPESIGGGLPYDSFYYGVA